MPIASINVRCWGKADIGQADDAPPSRERNRDEAFRSGDEFHLNGEFSSSLWLRGDSGQIGHVLELQESI